MDRVHSVKGHVFSTTYPTDLGDLHNSQEVFFSRQQCSYYIILC